MSFSDFNKQRVSIKTALNIVISLLIWFLATGFIVYSADVSDTITDVKWLGEAKLMTNFKLKAGVFFFSFMTCVCQFDHLYLCQEKIKTPKGKGTDTICLMIMAV